MTHGAVSIRDSASVADAAAVLEEEDIHGAPVVTSYGKLVGVVTRTDIVRHLRDALSGDEEKGERGLLDALLEEGLASRTDELLGTTTSVQAIMSSEPVTAGLDATAGELARLMHRDSIHRVFIVDGEAVQGVVSAGDLMKVLERYESDRQGQESDG